MRGVMKMCRSGNGLRPQSYLCNFLLPVVQCGRRRSVACAPVPVEAWADFPPCQQQRAQTLRPQGARAYKPLGQICPEPLDSSIRSLMGSFSHASCAIRMPHFQVCNSSLQKVAYLQLYMGHYKDPQVTDESFHTTMQVISS